MDSITVQRLISEALKLSPNDPKSNGYGLALAVVVGLGLFCIGGFVYALKRYEGYRDRTDAANELRWKEENTARIAARDKFSEQIDCKFDKLERYIDQAFDEIEIQIKAIENRNADDGKRIDRLIWEKENHGKKQ